MFSWRNKICYLKVRDNILYFPHNSVGWCRVPRTGGDWGCRVTNILFGIVKFFSMMGFFLSLLIKEELGKER